MLNFSFSEKGLGLVSLSYFVYDFSRKMFFVLNFINWPSFIVWLPLLLKILGNSVLRLFANQAVNQFVSSLNRFISSIELICFFS